MFSLISYTHFSGLFFPIHLLHSACIYGIYKYIFLYINECISLKLFLWAIYLSIIVIILIWLWLSFPLDYYFDIFFLFHLWPWVLHFLCVLLILHPLMLVHYVPYHQFLIFGRATGVWFSVFQWSWKVGLQLDCC